MTHRVAVVGVGRMGQVHCRIVAENPRSVLSAVIDPVEVGGRAVGEQFGVPWFASVEEALAADAADAFIVAVPDRLHVDVTVSLLAAGRHVLLEKPLADTLPGAQAIASAAAASAATLLVGLVLRHDPRFRVAAGAVAAGKVGEAVHVRSARIVPRSVGLANRGLSPIYMYQGVHDVDLVQWIAGSRIRRVCATTAAKLLPAAGAPGVDAAVVLLELENGAIGVLEISWVLPDATPSGLESAFELYGTEGVVKVDVTSQGVSLFAGDRLGYPDTVLGPELDGLIEGAVPAQFAHFLDLVEGIASPRVALADAVAATAVLDAIGESLETGAWAEVQTVP